MEIFDIYDGNGDKTGQTAERGTKLKADEYAMVADVWIRNKSGLYLISRRTPNKVFFPCVWEPTCGTAISGENSFDTALREVKEELGLTLYGNNGKKLKRIFLEEYGWMVDIWIFNQDFDINSVILQPGETDSAKWASKEEIIDLQKNGSFIVKSRIPYLHEFL